MKIFFQPSSLSSRKAVLAGHYITLPLPVMCTRISNFYPFIIGLTGLGGKIGISSFSGFVLVKLCLEVPFVSTIMLKRSSGSGVITGRYFCSGDGSFDFSDRAFALSRSRSRSILSRSFALSAISLSNLFSFSRSRSTSSCFSLASLLGDLVAGDLLC